MNNFENKNGKNLAQNPARNGHETPQNLAQNAHKNAQNQTPNPAQNPPPTPAATTTTSPAPAPHPAILASRQMPRRTLIFSALALAAIIVIANYTVQFNILHSPLTYGALTYPFSFLLLDILSEKYTKRQTLCALALGLALAFVPSYFAATPQIALASIAAFCVAQPLDVVLFYALKRAAPRVWWLRGVSSTLVAQFIDTLIFFGVAFWGVQTLGESLTMAVADYCIKAMLGAVNIPLFWYFAIAPLRRVGRAGA